MCKASFVRNEKKADTIRLIPPISSNQFSFRAHTQFETAIPPFTQPLYLLCYHHRVTLCYICSTCVLLRIYCTCHPHDVGMNPPSSSLLPLAAWWSRTANLYWCTPRDLGGNRYQVLPEKVSPCERVCWIRIPRRSSVDASRQLVDDSTILLPETAIAFHRKGAKLMAALDEQHRS